MAKEKEVDIREIKLTTHSIFRKNFWVEYLESHGVEYEDHNGVCGQYVIEFDIDYNKLDKICSGLLIPSDNVTVAYFE